MQALDTAFPGNPLDEVGLGQADGLPDRLDKAGLLQGLGSLWVSPILRARQTIAPIEAATGLSATVDSGLREVLAADLEMNTDARSVACYVDTTRAWMAGRLPHPRLPGGRARHASALRRGRRPYLRAGRTGGGLSGPARLPRHRAASVDLPEGRGRRRRGPAVGR